LFLGASNTLIWPLAFSTQITTSVTVALPKITRNGQQREVDVEKANHLKNGQSQNDTYHAHPLSWNTTS